MPYIKVDLDKIRGYQNGLELISTRVRRIKNDFNSISNRLDWDVSSERRIRNICRNIVDDLATEQKSLNKMSNFASVAIRQYDSSTNKNLYLLKKIREPDDIGFNTLDFLERLKDIYLSHWHLNIRQKYDLSALLMVSPFERQNILMPRKNSYGDIFASILRNGFDATVIRLADQYNIAKDRMGDLAECIKYDLCQAYKGFISGVKTGAKKISNKIADVKTAVVKDWNAKGISYKVVNVGKAAVNIVAGVATTACAIAGTGITAGLGTPATVLIGTYGANQAISGFADLYNCLFGDVEKVGNVDLLKSSSKFVFGNLGGLIGQKENGEKLGEVVYAVGGLTTTLVSLANLSGQIKQAHTASSTLKGSIQSAKNLATGALDEIKYGFGQIGHLIKNSNVGGGYSVSALKYQLALLKMQMTNLPKLVSDFNLVQKSVEGVHKVIKVGISSVNTFVGDELIKEPVIFKKIENVSQFKDILTNESKKTAVSNFEKITDSGKVIYQDNFVISLGTGWLDGAFDGIADSEIGL